jgi:hypothetical protein
MGALRWISWWYRWDCCKQSGSSHQENYLRYSSKTTIWELPSRKQPDCSYQGNNLRARIKKTILDLPFQRCLSWWELWDCCLDGSSQMVFLMGPLRLLSWWKLWDFCLVGSGTIRISIWELPSRQQSQSSHQESNLRAPIKTVISELPSRQTS